MRPPLRRRSCSARRRILAAHARSRRSATTCRRDAAHRCSQRALVTGGAAGVLASAAGYKSGTSREVRRRRREVQSFAYSVARGRPRRGPAACRTVRPPRAVMRGAADNHIIPQTIKRKRRGRIPCLDYSPARLRADHGRSLSFLLLGAPSAPPSSGQSMAHARRPSILYPKL